VGAPQLRGPPQAARHILGGPISSLRRRVMDLVYMSETRKRGYSTAKGALVIPGFLDGV